MLPLGTRFEYASDFLSLLQTQNRAFITTQNGKRGSLLLLELLRVSTTSEAVIEHFYKTAGKSCLRATEGLNVVKLEWKLAFIFITLVLWIRWAFELNSIKTNTLSENHSHHVTCSFWTRWSWWLLYNKETSGLPPKNAGTAEYNCSFLSRPNQQTISHKVTKRRSNNRICFLSNKILKP